ncbi:MAG: nicotinamide riboside transporter PnuC [Muribaculaceae bacterium]|nr:nicotinamide riboside transporter PnuC [Muribaculaceae bacterium]MDE6610712.1 nicotinamide riboside transporter PnuC [Muribaculaceae bacterium]
MQLLQQWLSDFVAWWTPDRGLEVLGFITGLFYIYYEYHANAKVWIATIIMPAISIWVYYRAGIYADFGINIYYFIMAIYGYWHWTRHKSHRTEKQKKSELPITHTPSRVWLPWAAVSAAIYFGIAAILIYLTDSTVPWIDAFTTALSITATWLLARKYIEQWWAWMAVDAVCVGLFIYKGIYFYAVLYFIYTAICMAGYMKWKRLMNVQK